MKQPTLGTLFDTVISSAAPPAQHLCFPHVVDASPEPILITNANGEIYYVNPAWEKFTGYTLIEVKGKNPRFLRSGKTHPGLYKRMWHALKNGNSFSTEEIIDRKKNGEEYQVHSIFFPVRKNNETAFYIQTQHDITLRKHLDEFRNRLAFMVQSSNDAIIAIDKQGFILEWNPAAERLFGFTVVEAIGQHITIIVPENRVREREKIFNQLHSGIHITNFETQRKRKDGKCIDVSLTVSQIKDAKGTDLGYSSIVRDITTQKEDARQKDTFIGIASHELKTPITSLKIYTQMLQKRLAKSNNPANIKLIRTINDQTDRLVNLINDLLNVSRLESGRMLIRKKSFQLTELAQKVVDTIQQTTKTHNIRIQSSITKPVYADETKIEEVLINLLTNAIKYSPDANEIIITIIEQKSQAIVSVQDFGIGISPLEQKHVFDRFYRTEDTQEARISGFGLGLYIAAEIIKRHNAKIWVKSEKGKGSTFFFSLPLGQQNHSTI